MSLRQHLAAMPLVAILRGLTPEEAPDAFAALVNAGFRIIEVPLNSPQPFETIAYLSDRAGADLLIGAGTVLSVEEARAAAQAGARLMVAPNCDASGDRRRQGPWHGDPARRRDAERGLRRAQGRRRRTEAVSRPSCCRRRRSRPGAPCLPAGTLLLLPVGGVSLGQHGRLRRRRRRRLRHRQRALQARHGGGASWAESARLRQTLPGIVSRTAIESEHFVGVETPIRHPREGGSPWTVGFPLSGE